MGLLRGLVLLPLAPVEGVVWIARQLQAQAEREWLDPQAVYREMAELQDALDAGAVTEEEYLRAEEGLLDRLDAIEAGEGGEL